MSEFIQNKIKTHSWIRKSTSDCIYNLYYFFPGGSLHEGILCQELPLDWGPDLCVQGSGLRGHSYGVSIGAPRVAVNSESRVPLETVVLCCCLCRDAADLVVQGKGKFEELMVCSHEIAASTAQLVAASKVSIVRLTEQWPINDALCTLWYRWIDYGKIIWSVCCCLTCRSKRTRTVLICNACSRRPEVSRRPQLSS